MDIYSVYNHTNYRKILPHIIGYFRHYEDSFVFCVEIIAPTDYVSQSDTWAASDTVMTKIRFNTQVWF